MRISACNSNNQELRRGIFAGVGDTFTNGTVHIVANNGVYKALGIIFIVQIVLALIMLSLKERYGNGYLQ